MKELLEEGDNINVQTHDGWTPLHGAVFDGHENAVQLLVERGADLHIGQEDGFTPLHAASREGHVNIVRLLLDHGAGVDARTSQSYTPMHVAAWFGRMEVERYLRTRGADLFAISTKFKWTFAHNAVDGGYDAMLRFLLEQGVDFHRRTNDGWTCLHIETARFLLDLRTDWHAKNSDEMTALDCAAFNGNVESVRFLRNLSRTMRRDLSPSRDGSTLAGNDPHRPQNRNNAQQELGNTTK